MSIVNDKFLVFEWNNEIKEYIKNYFFILHQAAHDGDLNKIKHLIENEKFNVNTSNYEKKLPIHYAAAEGELDVIISLIIIHK